MILSGAHAEIMRGDVASPDVRLRGPGASLARVFLDESARTRLPAEITVEGSAESVRALLAAFATSDVQVATLASSRAARSSGRINELETDTN